MTTPNYPSQAADTVRPVNVTLTVAQARVLLAVVDGRTARNAGLLNRAVAVLENISWSAKCS